MQFTKREALFIYSTLKQHKTERELCEEDEEKIENVLATLEGYLCEEEVDDVKEVVEHKDTITADANVTPQVLEDLQAIEVIDPSGDVVNFYFDSNGSVESVDAYVDEGSVVIETVTHVKLVDNEIHVFDGDEWHFFNFNGKTPKAWKKILSDGLIYSIEHEEEEKEEEED